VAGKMPDKRAADDAPIAYPARATLDKDSGFQGYEPAGVLTRQPKKPRGQELSVADKGLNGLICGVRVVVEQVISGVKRCRIIKEVFLTQEGMSDQGMEMACDLPNLRVSCRHPLPMFSSVLSLSNSA
jgi:hypothetical protein